MKRFLRALPGVRQFLEMKIAQELMATELRFMREELAWAREERECALARARDPRSLRPSERKVYSQNGEDGVLAEIVRRIGAPTRTFVEIGVGDGWENNTLLLLTLGWSGAWVDADPALAATVAGWPAETAARLRWKCAMVTRENAAALLRELAAPAEPDVLSLDIDRNTHHIWEALADWRPRIAVVEYNPWLPPGVDWAMPYDAAGVWDGSLNFGASLKALERLGRERGYRLVHCDSAGVNAFFVREDLAADRFEGPATAEHHHRPQRIHIPGLVAPRPRALLAPGVRAT